MIQSQTGYKFLTRRRDTPSPDLCLFHKTKRTSLFSKVSILSISAASVWLKCKNEGQMYVLVWSVEQMFIFYNIIPIYLVNIYTIHLDLFMSVHSSRSNKWSSKLRFPSPMYHIKMIKPTHLYPYSFTWIGFISKLWFIFQFSQFYALLPSFQVKNKSHWLCSLSLSLQVTWSWRMIGSPSMCTRWW